MASSAIAVAMLGGCSAGSVAAPKARSDLYTCDGCEAALERDRASLGSVARIAGPGEPGDALIATGTVYLPDGRTPASDVIVYAHHTNAQGYYAGGDPNASGSARHGKLKGWVRTDDAGLYRFETIKPAPYPSMTMPAHIHLYISEAGRPTYYIDDIVFAGEFAVDVEYRAAQELRGGSGITMLERNADGVLVARRDIILERHP
ncbi:hypothetical protein [Qipengyuania sp. ASV99]|uniref:dioxygenase family protein n=1 Tax=Qipengyuania sp. ASV99 TaxID=3399681 RepID=UPI003A4C5C5C